MKYYIELTLMDNPDFNLYTLWSKLYTQLHLAFVEQKDSQEKIVYGVSFPRYRLSSDKGIGFLGDKLRIFAHSTQELEQLNLNKWLERLNDYVHITAPRETPNNVSYAIYSRAVPKDSVEKRILHQAQRRNISITEAATHFKDHVYPPLIEPFISLKSLSGQHIFKLHIKKTLTDEASMGKFGTYGLSKTVTVPEF